MNDVLRKIRKLLALGNDTRGNEHERDNALRAAHALLAKHNLDMAAVEASGAAPEEQREQHGFVAHGRHRAWARSVAHSAANLFFCEYLFTQVDPKHIRHVFIGKTSNTVTAAEMTEYLMTSILKEAKCATDDERSFCLGAATAIRIRVNQLMKPPPVMSDSTALALVNVYESERRANALVKKQLYPRLRTSRSGSKPGLAAFSAGQKFGASVSLNRQVSGASKAPKLTKV